VLAFIYIRNIRVGCISEKIPVKFLTLYRNEKYRMFFQPVRIRGKLEKKTIIINIAPLMINIAPINKIK